MTNWRVGTHYSDITVESTGQCPYCYNVRDYNIRGGGKCVDIRDSHCTPGSYLIYFEMDKEIPRCPHCGKRGRFYMHEIDSLDVTANESYDLYADNIHEGWGKAAQPKNSWVNKPWGGGKW